MEAADIGTLGPPKPARRPGFVKSSRCLFKASNAGKGGILGIFGKF